MTGTRFDHLHVKMKINNNLVLRILFIAKEISKEIEARDGVGVFFHTSLV